MRIDRQVPIVTVNAREAAKALGVSHDWFERHVSKEVPRIKRGRMVLYRVDALTKWAERNTDWGK